MTSQQFVVVQLLSHVLLFCNPTNCSPSGSSVLEISQARILGWVAISFSRGSSQPKDQTLISYISWTPGGFVYHWATTEAANRRLKKEREKNALLNLQINAPDLKSKQTIKTLRGNTGKQTVQMQEGRTQFPRLLQAWGLVFPRTVQIWGL